MRLDRNWSRAVLLAIVAPLALAWVAPAAAADADARSFVTEVRVERVRPRREKHATLRFLKANRDFIRGRFDLLRETPEESRAEAAPLDPRFLAYQNMLAGVFAAGDSLDASEAARARRLQFESVAQLAELESELDRMEGLLAAQRERLGMLQADFTGRQRTALEIVVSGDPGDAAVTAVTISLEDGSTLSIPLSDVQRASLRQGGVLQLFHGLVEPREQTIEVALAGERWPEGAPGFVTLEPSRDRLTLLHLDLTPARAERGASSLTATTSLLDTGRPGPGDKPATP